MRGSRGCGILLTRAAFSPSVCTYMSVSASIQLESVSTRIVDELEPGDGASFPKVGDKLLVHYTGCLAATGRCFDSSRARGHAFTFTVGCGKVIKGWDVLLLRLCKGQRVKLHVGAVDGYGAAGSPPNVPANADLLFDVELIDINEPLVKEGIRYRKELEDKARREVEEQQERDAKAAMASEGPKAAASGPKRPRESDESGSGSDSDSSSSSSESSGAARKRKERKKDKKKEKREKKRRERKEAKKSSKKEAKRGRKKEKKKKRDRETVQRSVITGKRLKLDDSAADTEGRAP